MAHSSIVGGSSAARVLACPASVRLAAEIPPGPSSSYAAEGTACHHIMEQCLLQDTAPDPDVWIGMELEGVDITQALFYDKIIPAWEATEQAFTDYKVVELEPEAEVHFKTIPGAFGTCDIMGVTTAEAPILLDYKFGDGVLISPIDNKQLLFYAAAAMEDDLTGEWFTGDDDQVVHLGIIQPAQDEPLQVWDTTIKAVKQFRTKLQVAIRESEKAGIEPHAGDHCRWCPAAPTCPAKLGVVKKALRMSPDALEDLSEALDLAEELGPWIKQVQSLVHQRLEAGDKVPGYKLVEKRATRKWLDEQSALAKLKALKKLKLPDYTTVKLCTPPQLEKICKAKSVDFAIFADYIGAVSSGTTVAHEDDARTGVVLQADRKIPENLANKMQ